MNKVLTNRWRGVTALAFFAAGIGVLFGRPGTLLLSVVGVAYAAYAQSEEAPDATISLDRVIAQSEPEPGDEVEVSLQVTNVGDDILPDLRIVDGVPPALATGEGSPRIGTSLRPGESDTLEYTIVAQRGVHEFETSTILTRNWSGTTEAEHRMTEPGSIRCIPELEPSLDAFPLRKQTIQHAGRVTTDTGGPGIEFHSTREYRHGDPLPRIDWKRRAKTGEFTTVQFREEEAATIALVIDTRRDAYVTDSDDTSAVEHEIRAARAVGPTLMEEGNSVGVAAFGPVWTWLRPGLGRSHRARLRETLATGEGFTALPSDERYLPRHTVRQLRKNLPGDAQVIFFSPVADDYLVTTLRRIEAYGHAVTLVSPDVTDGRTHGGIVAQMERAERLRAIRAAGIRIVDWDPSTSLNLAVTNARRGWSR